MAELHGIGKVRDARVSCCHCHHGCTSLMFCSLMKTEGRGASGLTGAMMAGKLLYRPTLIESNHLPV